MSILRKLWWGQYPLPAAFWGFYVLGFVAVFFLMALILVTSYHLHLGTVGFIIGFLVITGYWFIASFGVWRSAATNIASPVWMARIWGIAARGIVLLFAARFLWGLINGGALTLMERMTARMDF
jgi:hypothetical protein